jgi:hypothetical protein
MSVEASVLTVLGKYVWLPLLGVLGWFTKSYFDKLEARLTEAEKVESLLKDRLGALEMELTKNYYDKFEIKQHIADPLQTSINETRADLKAFSAMLREIHSDMSLLKFKILEENKKDK